MSKIKKFDKLGKKRMNRRGVEVFKKRLKSNLDLNFAKVSVRGEMDQN